MMRYEWNIAGAVEFEKERSNRCTQYLSVESSRDCHLVIKPRHNLHDREQIET